MAFVVSKFSKDPKTQHGCVVVTQDNYPLGWGYNGPPRSYDDKKMNWDRPHKYKNMVHSEINAMNHSDPNLLRGSILYVTGKPCDACMLAIASRGVSKVVYFQEDRYDEGSMERKSEIFKNTDEIAKRSKVKLEAFKGDLNWIKEVIA